MNRIMIKSRKVGSSLFKHLGSTDEIMFANKIKFCLRILLLTINLAGKPATTLAEQPSSNVPLSSQQNPEPDWWSFRSPRRSTIPTVADETWVQKPIDAFVLARLEAQGLKHAPAANRRTLIRRAYFDLIGLPPTPQQIENFLNDESSEAYVNLIEDLLASPHYGERWGRHWLDVVRYAETCGYEGDSMYPNAWRYRDYVIKSFDDDKPYDRFIQEQIAGDQFWPDNLNLLDGKPSLRPEKSEHLEAWIGTGLYTFGPEIGESVKNESKLLYETLTDWVDVTGAAFLGLSLGCARCHDHKYDPLLQRDYYAMQAVFAGSRRMEIPVVTKMKIREAWHNYPKLLGVVEAKKAYRLFMAQVKNKAQERLIASFSDEVRAAYNVQGDKRTAQQQKLAEPLNAALQTFRTMQFEVFMGEENDVEIYDYLTPEELEEQQRLLQRMGQALRAVPDGVFDGILAVPTASVIGPCRAELAPEIHVLHRGELGSPREKVGPSSPSVLSAQLALADCPGKSPRMRLAQWLTQPDHPLTARVMVNRIWQWHFGAGIVRTSNDFGQQGAPPTHPELLDWLAREFIARGWSIKSMHRLIMLSSTYQMSSSFTDSENIDLDSENQYLWRMNRRRLEGEAVWDAMHSVAGTLNLKKGGRSVVPPLADDESTVLRIGRPTLNGNYLWTWPVSADPNEHQRRGVYILVRRAFTFPMFQLFDSPDNAVSCPKRDVTNVAPQALWFLNNQVVFQQATALAKRVARKGNEPSVWVDNAWNLVLGRHPSEQEQLEALKLFDSLAAKEAQQSDGLNVADQSAPSADTHAAALTKLCVTLFNLNEFLYVD